MLPGAARGAEGRWGREADSDALKGILEQGAVDARQLISRTQQLQENRSLCKRLAQSF